MIDQKEIEKLETGLDSFSPGTRKESLRRLMALVDEGLIPVPEPIDQANLHCHSFFSYNAYGYSPTHLAWLGRKQGIKFMGIVDFDILDGVDEFLDACRITGVRGTAGIETRVHIPEFRHAEINSPGEPGISYHMGVGFVRSKVTETVEAAFSDIRQQAVQRNVQIIQRINAFLVPFRIDFEEDVLPLTPSGYATERHIVQKIAEKSFEKLADPLQFWSEKLGQPTEIIDDKLKDPNAFKDFLRQKLIKRGGVAYVPPEGKSFPTVEAFHQIILAEGAIPCLTWLDGTSTGEAEIEHLISLLIEKGAGTVNIIPDRNWNISDPEVKAVKLNNLYQIVDLANSLDLPIVVGTEMNSFGQKLVDDFAAPELASIKDCFIKGAYFLYGHTLMERMWGMGYQSEWSHKHLPDRKSKNLFYDAVGRLIPPNTDPEIDLHLETLGSADQILHILEKGLKAQ